MPKLAENKPAETPAKANTPFFNKGESSAFSATDSAAPFIQTKLVIGQSNDKYEKEADTVADKVVQRLTAPEVSSKKEAGVQAKPLATTLTPFVQTKCASCEQEDQLQKKEDDPLQKAPFELQRKPIFESNAEPPDDEKNIQRKCAACDEEEKIQKKSEGQSDASPSVEANLQSSKGSGSPLPPSTKEKMEGAIGADFSNVRVHTNSSAVQMNKELGAHAFAHGNDIYFNSGKYDPTSKEGNHLLAHELTHTVQQGGSAPQEKKKQDNAQHQFSKTDEPRVQGKWYNFDIPFTDYQFDASIEGVKTAAGVVADKAKEGATWAKDKIAEGLEWMVDQVVSLVDTGKNYLIGKFEEIREFSGSVLDNIKDGFKGVASMITSPISTITSALTIMNVGMLKTGWSLLVSGAKLVWSSMKTIINGILNIGTGIWNTVSGFITGIFNSIGYIINSRVFDMLPDFLIQKARNLFAGLKSYWNSIKDFWDSMLKRVTKFVNNLLTSIEKFVARVVSYAIGGLVKVVDTLKKAYDFVKLLTTDPASILRPLSDQVAGKINAEAPGKAKEVAKQKLDEAGNGPTDSSTNHVIQRSPDTTEERRTATRAEVNESINSNLAEQFGKLNVKSMLWDTLVNMFYPPALIKAIGHEFYELWTTDWTNAVNSFFTPRTDEVGHFFHDVWSNILVLLEFPLTLWKRLNSILMLLMGYVTVILILGGAIVGGPAGALAGAKLAFTAGEFLFYSYLTAESAYALKMIIDLYTARQTKAERNRDYYQIATSVIGLGIAIIVAALFFLLGALVSRVVTFLKGKTPPAPKPETPKLDTPTTEPPKTEPPKTDPSEPPKEEPPKTEPDKLELPKATLKAKFATVRKRLNQIAQQVEEMPEILKDKAVAKQKVNEATEKLNRLEKDAETASSAEDIDIIDSELDAFNKKDLNDLQNFANSTNIPPATPEEKVLIDQYTDAIQRLRQATETIKAGTDKAAVKTAEVNRAEALKQLDAIEQQAMDQHNVPGSKLSRLADHLNSMTKERTNIELDSGVGDPSIGLSFPDCDAVAAVRKLPGGSLNGLSFGDIQTALGKPTSVTGSLTDAAGLPTGAVRIEWSFPDGSRLHVDVPGSANSSPYAINRSPHAGLNAPRPGTKFPNSDQAFSMSDKGTVVPGNSAAAHVPVKKDGALTYLLQGAKKSK